MNRNFFAGLISIIWISVFAVQGSSEIRDITINADKISYNLTESDSVFIDVFSTEGSQPVSIIFAGLQQQGQHTLVWDKKDVTGNSLPKGKYNIRFRIGKSAVRDNNFGEKGFIQLTNPVCVRTDYKGNVYVLDLLSKGHAVGTGGGTLIKFTPEGKPALDFYRWYGAKPDEPKVSTISVPRFAVWVEVINDETILYNEKNTITVREIPRGKVSYSFGGFQWKLDENYNFSPEKGSVFPVFGIAIGNNNRVYIRDWDSIKVYDMTKRGFDGYLYSSEKVLDKPPVEGIYIGPCIATDRKGKIYTTGVKGLSRFTDTGKEIKKEYMADVKFKECMGLTYGNDGMVYVVDRGIGLEDEVVSGKKKDVYPRVYQFFDNGKELKEVWYFEDKELTGLHDIALSPDCLAIYLIEDTADFGIRGKNIPGVEKQWPQRALTGKGRLFKYNIVYKQEIAKEIQIQ